MQWKSPEEWEPLKNGIDCPMCQDLHLATNPFSFLIIELKQSYVRLPRNQFMRGWTIVALKRHASELFELSPVELAEFWEDVSLVAKALDAIYEPAKINYCVLGNLCPHVHCHLVMRSYADDPNKPLDMTEREVLLADEEYAEMIEELRIRIAAA